MTENRFTGKGHSQITVVQNVLKARNKRLLSGELKPQNYYDYAFLNPGLVETIMKGLI